jgi:site-specific DNA-cytosine methylase
MIPTPHTAPGGSSQAPANCGALIACSAPLSYSPPLRVLVACEFSGAVRRTFRALGHYAYSCDLLPSEDDSPYHIQGDAIAAAYGDFAWDLMICHPPCTDLAVSGARHFAAKKADGRQDAALQFVRDLLAAPIPRIALENPISIISSQIRKPDQIIQPWQFGHGETKATCLWLKGLPPLRPTDVVSGREARIHKMPPGPNRWKERSRTFAGIAAAMAGQWGGDSRMTGHRTGPTPDVAGVNHAIAAGFSADPAANAKGMA